MNNELSTWDDVRRVADELELHIHLAGMNARDQWHELEPRLEKLEQQIARSGERAGQTITRELREIGSALRAVRDDVLARVRVASMRGW